MGKAFDEFYEEQLDQDFETVGPPVFNDVRAAESLAATLAVAFASRGDDFAVGLLVNAKHRLARWADAITDKLAYYVWEITVSPQLFGLYQAEQQEAWDAGVPDFATDARFLAGPLVDDVKRIEVKPALEKDPAWRDHARRYLSGEGINNQAHVVPQRPKIIHDDLWFRHIEEQRVYEVLLRKGHIFMPLPVVMRANGKKRPNGVNARIEPDFCILYNGRLVVIEVDGGSHWEAPAEAEERVQFLREQGAYVRRIMAGKCSDMEATLLAVDDALSSIDREMKTR